MSPVFPASVLEPEAALLAFNASNASLSLVSVAIKGFTIILDDVTKEDTTKKKAMTNDLVRLISINYSTMGLNEKALDLLKKAEKPKDANDTKGFSVYKGIQLRE